MLKFSTPIHHHHHHHHHHHPTPLAGRQGVVEKLTAAGIVFVLLDGDRRSIIANAAKLKIVAPAPPPADRRKERAERRADGPSGRADGPSGQRAGPADAQSGTPVVVGARVELQGFAPALKFNGRRGTVEKVTGLEFFCLS